MDRSNKNQNSVINILNFTQPTNHQLSQDKWFTFCKFISLL